MNQNMYFIYWNCFLYSLFASQAEIQLVGFYIWPNPSICSMALGMHPPQTEMSTRNLPGCKGRPTIRLNTSQPSVSRVSIKCGVCTSNNTMVTHGVLQRNTHLRIFKGLILLLHFPPMSDVTVNIPEQRLWSVQVQRQTFRVWYFL
jgi:hypothetical protein